MADFKLKKGHNLKIVGQAEKRMEVLPPPKRVAVLPNEFNGIRPRLTVQVDDAVKIGTPLFHSKDHPEIKFVAPVSGRVVEINRGERRKLLEIVIENDGKNEAEQTGQWNIGDMQRDKLIEALLDGGMWPLIRQRPFSKIANPGDTPRAIFISAMDTSPLAADPEFLLEDEAEDFQTGLEVLQKLTDGNVHLTLDGGRDKHVQALQNARGVEKHSFSGPHPAGNVGVHIHHIDPIRLGGDFVWYVQPQGVALIGKFFKQGYFANERKVAKAGSSLKNRNYYKTIVGAPISTFIPESDIVDEEVRYISGNVLTGRKISAKGFVSYYDPLITVIPEGSRERKLIGYFRPGSDLPSFSKTFLSSFLKKNGNFTMDTRMFGAKRAFVQTGSYENVLPMDIYPMALMKSILAEDVEEMEGLGILELDEEDVALCSYIDLSKTDFCGLLRKGLDLIESEG